MASWEKGGRLTMAGTKLSKPGLSPDRRMKHAAVKPELEVIADPKGTAVNKGPATAKPANCPRWIVRAYRTQSLDMVSTHTQGDWRWRARIGSSGVSGMRVLCVSIAGQMCGLWQEGRLAIIVHVHQLGITK